MFKEFFSQEAISLETKPEKNEDPIKIYAKGIAEKAVQPLAEIDKDKIGDNYWKTYWNAYWEAYWERQNQK